jgi:hypothetical protein
VAVDAVTDRLAVGDAEGVSWRVLGADARLPTAGHGWQRVALPGAVLDLAFDADGTLLAATTRGLWRVDGAGRRRDVSPSPGDDARWVSRVAMAAGFVVAATRSGLYASENGGAWRRVDGALPLAPFTALALRATAVDVGAVERGSRVTVYAVAEERLFRVDLAHGEGSVEVSAVRRVEIAGWPRSQAVVDLVADLAGHRLVVLFTRSLARTLRSPTNAMRWEVVHPVLAPGVTTSRLVSQDDEVWLATDHGLLGAERWPVRWRRAASPAGSTPIRSLAAGRGVVFAVEPNGLLVGRPASAPGPVAGRALLPDQPSGTFSREPDLRLVHAQALQHAGLEPEYYRNMRRRLSRRGWVPDVVLRAGAAYDRDTDEDYDQAFTSGQVRHLTDRYAGLSRDFEGVLTLSWDLGDVVYPPDASDWSREERQVITLRDTILDEVNQLYFDRRRALAALARYADRTDPAAVELEIRCLELAAGLDAWTGGWFSAQLDAPRDGPAR